MAKSKTEIVSKSKNIAKSAISKVAKNPLPALYVGAGLLGIYVIFKGFQLAKKTASEFLSDDDAGGGNVDFNNAGSVPFGATITNAQAETAASNILSAVRSFGQLDNEEFETVKKEFRNRNAKDFALISEAFGEPAREPTFGQLVPALLGSKLTLSQWLSAETLNWQKDQLRQIMPDVF